MHSESIPHRTDRKRGARVRVAPGIFDRAGKLIVSYIDSSGADRYKTLGWKKSDAHQDGVTLSDAKAIREKLRVQTRAGELPVPQKTTVGEVAREFFALFESLVVAGEKSQRTLELYRQRYRSHLEKPLG